MKEKIPLEQREQSISVQNTFDNCFFHAFAAYLLSNDLPLPENLFSIDQNEQVSSNNKAAEQLKNLFSSPEDLEIFDHYQTFVNPNSKSNHLVEKTLILAVLLREWFAQQLFANKNHQTYLFDNKHDISFKGLASQLQSVEDDEEILTLIKSDDRANVIYSANEDFFQNIQNKNEEEIAVYWQQEGYKNYCQYLANLGVKIAYTDIAPVLKDLNQTYTIFDKSTGNIITSNQGNVGLPPFEAMIHSPGEHYYLLKPAESNPLLEEYENSLAEYRQGNDKISAIGIAELAQSQILSMDEIEHRKKEICSQSNCLLLDAVCSAGADVITSFNALIDGVKNIKQKIIEQLETVNKPSPAQPEERSNSFEGFTSDEESEDDDSLIAEFSKDEKDVIKATVSTQSDPQKAKQYKANLIELFKFVKENNGFFNSNKNNHDIAHSPNLIGEYDIDRDEELAKSLQEEEFKRVKLL